MKQPKNSTGSNYISGNVRLLQTSIYGRWNALNIRESLFHKELVCLRFKQLPTDSRMSIEIFGSEFENLVVVVDDLLISSDSKSIIEGVEAEMKTFFQSRAFK